MDDDADDTGAIGLADAPDDAPRSRRPSEHPQPDAERAAERRRGRNVRVGMSRLLVERLQDRTTGNVSVDDAGARSLTAALLQDASREGTSDIHLDPHSGGYNVRFRVDGELHDVALLSPSQAQRLLNQLKTVASLDPVAHFKPQESRWSYELDDRKLDLRLATTPSVAGEKMSIRLLDTTTAGHHIDELGFSTEELDDIKAWINHPSGLILVTGPTGSGKTTTLYALLHQLKYGEAAVITIEDPVEYLIDGITQIQVDHAHGLTFGEGVKAVLRLDPDHVMIGEIRDRASAESAMDAAITGRIVMSTLHSRDAVAAVTALRNRGAKDHEIAATLSMVVAQRLVRLLCENCRKQRDVNDFERSWLASMGHDAPDHAWDAEGCDQCHGVGFTGRTGIFEVWSLRDRDFDLILDHAGEKQIRAELKRRKHRSLFADAVDMARRGETTFEEVWKSTSSAPQT